ncbi:MAG: LysE family transporter [Candidatus Dormibacteraeota bacterium]|nr:LysE family transporter [Candidatus Dormibacteraeota bacterium]
MASVLLRGFVLGFVIAASPGPIFFLCLRRTLTRGALTGLVSGFGVATADGFYAVLAAFGIGAVTSVLVGERRWLALIGGAVLVLLGLRTMLDRPTTAEPTPATNGSGVAWAYLSTLGLTIANPSTIVSFAALVASMSLGISGGFLPPALFVLGVFAGSATWWCVLAGFGAGLRARVTPRAVRGIGTLSGLAIAGLGMLAVYSAFS